MRLDLKLSDIKLYFFCKNGKRWYFEGGQRICHILQEKYWSVEKTLIPYKLSEPSASDANGANANDHEQANLRNAANAGFDQRKIDAFNFKNNEPGKICVSDYQALLKNYKPRELTELERIYVIFSRDQDLN